MFVDISPSRTGASLRDGGDGALQRARGGARVGLRGAGSHSLKDLYQRSPCRVLMPRVDGRDRAEIVFANTAGGVAGGDRFDYAVSVDEGAAARVTTQASEKIYGAIDRPARISTSLTVGQGACLEWLPQQTIAFDGTRLHRRMDIEVAEGGRLLALDWLVLGRQARGENLTRGVLNDAWTVRRDGRMVWADRFRLSGDPASLISRRAALGGAAAFATIVGILPEPAEHLEALRGLVDEAGCEAGVTLVGGVLVMRFLAGDGLGLQRAVAGVLTGMHARTGYFSPAPPRVWNS
jgi:urease accessory protein